jgi:transcription termination/antitermination protein NusA
MDPNELLRIVDAIHRDKNIDKEVVFEGIEAALVSAAKKHYGEDADIVVEIDRTNGSIQGSRNGEPMDPAEMAERIGAQTAKQVMIQKIREAERDALYGEYEEIRGQLVTGVIQRYEGGAATVTLANVEAILPKGEQIPGETHHPNERVRATVYEVKKAGSRVKVILSRTKPQLVQRLFEQEIPEIAEGVIEIRAISREPGYRTKVAVSSTDQRIDCVGACVGVRGNRIKNIVDELSGERIDIVRWSDDMNVLIPNALQPAEVEEVILCQMLGRAIVLVQEDQLSLAIGRRGQNVRLASKLCGWDIEIMTREELDDQIEQAMVGFSSVEGVESELAERLVGEGFLSYDDLSIIEPESLMEMGGLTAEQVDQIVKQAESKAGEAERAAVQQRRQQRDQEREQEQERVEAADEAEAAAEHEQSADNADGESVEAIEQVDAEDAPPVGDVPAANEGGAALQEDSATGSEASISEPSDPAASNHQDSP